MPACTIRPFQRSDREQLTRLVNEHISAVMPGGRVSVNLVLQQLEREPGEFIVDPWVADRAVLVAEQQGAIVAAALLVRYRDDASVGEAFRGGGEIRWLAFWPEAPVGNPYWHDGRSAARTLCAAALAQFERWGISRVDASGTLPYPGVYGVPAQWPHVAALLTELGFEHSGRVEHVLLASLDALDSIGAAVEVSLHRSVGINGTRLTAVAGGESLGYIEVAHCEVERMQRSGIAEIGNLELAGAASREVAAALLGGASAWCRLGGIERLVAYATPDEVELLDWLRSAGFVEVTTTRVGWRAIGVTDRV